MIFLSDYICGILLFATCGSYNQGHILKFFIHETLLYLVESLLYHDNIDVICETDGEKMQYYMYAI